MSLQVDLETALSVITNQSFPWNNLKSLDFEVTDEQREEFTDIGLRHSADWELEVVIFDQRKPEYWNVFHKSV